MSVFRKKNSPFYHYGANRWRSEGESGGRSKARLTDPANKASVPALDRLLGPS